MLSHPQHTDMVLKTRETIVWETRVWKKEEMMKEVVIRHP